MGLLPDDFPELGENITQNKNSDIRLGIGEYTVVEENNITCHGLGSCLAIFLYDPVAGVGAGIHTLLPSQTDHPGQEVTDEDSDDATRFTDVGIQTIYKELTNHPEVNTENIVAKMTGGSDVLRLVTFSNNVGKRNVTSAREMMSELEIRITGEDVGGNSGRIVEFNPTTGGVIIRKADGKQTVI